MPSSFGPSLPLPFPDVAPTAEPAVLVETASPAGPGPLFVTDLSAATAGGPASQLVAEVTELRAANRGKLAALVEEAVESALRAKGAAAPGWASASFEDTLNDELFRARTAGATSLAIVLGPLTPLLDADGALDVRDSATLSFLATASRDRPMQLLLHASNADVRVYRETVSLAKALEPERPRGKKATPPPSPRATVQAPPIPSSILTVEVEPKAAAKRRDPRESETKRDTRYRAWVTQLRSARGPQPPAMLEKLFCQAYMPLAYAVEAGLDEPDAVATYEEFRHAFAKSYTEAFATFNSASRRPKMVLDAFECAGRMARLHGARTTQLLLIDSLRWDIGARLQHRLSGMLAPRAAITDEVILWSALPTKTPRQLDALAHGIGSLRDPWPPGDAPEEVVRDRTVESVRRLRAGARELHKLDFVEAKLQEAQAGALTALPSISERLAELVVKICDGLAPRTLLFVFGDHGFSISPTGVKQGGASPEEVLVPGFGIVTSEPQGATS